MHNHLPSRTAIVVALGCLCTLKLARPGFWDERVDQLLRTSLRAAGLPYRILESFSRTRTGSRLLNALMSAVIPGMFAHYVARKILIEKWTRHELEKGTKRLLVIGGGLDTLALRIATDYPAVTVEEWDHPATQYFKRRALASDLATRKNLQLSSIDLNETNEGPWQRLANAQTEPIIVVIEGVLMYLQEANVRNTLRNILSICTPQGSCILSFMEVDKSGRIGFRNSRKGFVDAWLSKRQESFLWGIQPSAMSDWLTQQGWKVRSLSDHSELKTIITTAGPALEDPAAGEHLVHAAI
jgi:methyltransferase (TIGR00027 family)